MRLLKSILGMAVIVGVLACASAPPAGAMPSAPQTDQPRTHLVLPAPKAGRNRPRIVMLVSNAGSETTDVLIPYGVLKEAGVAEVSIVSTTAGPVKLLPALGIDADETIAQFDASNPAGADVVIVPAMLEDPAANAWVSAQHAKGATIMSICNGAQVLAAAHLLDEKRATAHWRALNMFAKTYPNVRWVFDRRYVQDGSVISTTGISASIPASLALVEAIAGTDAAAATAERLGATGWSPVHDSHAFKLKIRDRVASLYNKLAPWRRETVEIPLENGIDEIALSLKADSWSRTQRATVVSTRPGAAEVTSRNGVRFRADATPKAGNYILPTRSGPSLRQLDAALADIDQRYGAGSNRLVRLGLEYQPGQ